QSGKPDAKSTWFRHMPRRCPTLLRSLPAQCTRPGTCEEAVFAARRAPPVSRSARDPSTRAPASDSPCSRMPPAVHIRRLPEAASAHPHTHRAKLPPLHLREPDAESAVAIAASRPAPSPERDSPANYATRPLTLLREIWDPLPDALFRSGPGSWCLAFLAATSLHR